jgi:hypothetical protein
MPSCCDKGTVVLVALSGLFNERALPVPASTRQDLAALQVPQAEVLHL